MTSARTSHTDDLALRQKRYVMSRSVRILCVVAATLAPVPFLWKGVFTIGAVALPSCGVVMADAGPTVSRGTKSDLVVKPVEAPPARTAIEPGRVIDAERWTSSLDRVPSYEGPDGALLHLDRLGAPGGTPVVVLHGGAACHPDYLGDLAGLSDVVPLVVPHLRGVGGSPAPADPAAGSYWQQAADVDVLRRHLGLDRVVLLAHSAGTRLAVAYAAQHPERVRALVLLGPPTSPLVDEPSDADAILARRTGPEVALAVAARETGPDLTDDDTFTAWQRATAPLAYARFDPVEQEHAAGGRWSLSAARAFFSVPPPDDLAALVSRLEAPVLVVAGTEDTSTGLAPVRAVARLFPAGRLVELEDCGHYPWVEQPAAFRAAVDSFLAEVLACG